MKLFNRWHLTKVSPQDVNLEKFQELASLRLKLLEVSRTLLALVKDSLWIIEELGTEKLLTQLDEVADRFSAKLKAGQADRLKQGLFEVVGAYLKKQRAYLSRKEAELKESISILSDGLGTLLTDNDVYHRRVLQLGDRLVDISRLGDLRQLKMALQVEVNQLKLMVVEKRDNDSDRLVKFSSHIRNLENKLKEAVKDAQRDALIGSFNRSAWQRQLSTCLDYSVAHRQPFLLVFLRVDEFPIILNQFGSQIGNRVLVALYKACQQVSRPTDFIARYTEETFSIIFPADSFRIIRKRLTSLVSEMAGSQYQFSVDDQSFTLGFTISVGLCQYRSGDNRETITERGLKALKLAEDLGKNRLCTEKDLKKAGIDA
jgi:diguanylate cyclase (GGDEF)-like protein